MSVRQWSRLLGSYGVADDVVANKRVQDVVACANIVFTKEERRWEWCRVEELDPSDPLRFIVGGSVGSLHVSPVDALGPLSVTRVLHLTGRDLARIACSFLDALSVNSTLWSLNIHSLYPEMFHVGRWWCRDAFWSALGDAIRSNTSLLAFGVENLYRFHPTERSRWLDNVDVFFSALKGTMLQSLWFCVQMGKRISAPCDALVDLISTHASLVDLNLQIPFVLHDQESVFDALTSNTTLQQYSVCFSNFYSKKQVGTRVSRRRLQRRVAYRADPSARTVLRVPFLSPTHDQLPPEMWQTVLEFVQSDETDMCEELLVRDIRSGFLYPHPMTRAYTPLLEGAFRIDGWA